MKNQLVVRSLATVFLVAALTARAEDKKDVTTKRLEKPPRHMMDRNRDEGPDGESPGYVSRRRDRAGEPDPGRSTRIAADIGLVVVRVMDGSPAADLLKEHDVLTKFSDQLLIDTRQLSVLVRARKEGEEVPLTLFRGGKEISLKAKLGQREMPRLAGPEPMFPPGAESGMPFFSEEMPGPGAMRMRQLPGMEREDVHNVLRMIGRERHNWFGAPPVHFFHRDDDKGSTMLNLAEGNFVFSDESGTVEVQAGEGKRELTVKNPKGEITFKGPIRNEEDRKKLPPAVMERLRKIENVDLNDEPGEDFEQETTVEPPVKTKIGQPLQPQQSRARVSPLPSF